MCDRNELMKCYENMKIGIDEPFKFHCTQCGKCCLHRDDILLNAKDLFQIARHFQLSPREVLEQYCETYIGHDSRLPIVRLKSRGSVKRCVFLKDRKCSIHEVKPTVCAIFPIGRAFQIKSDEDISKTTDTSNITYIFTNPGCGDDTELHTVREWFDSFHIPLEDAFFRDWSNTTILLSGDIKIVEEKVSEETMIAIWNAALMSLYLDYDITKDFQKQFQTNKKKLLEVIRTIADLASELLNDKRKIKA